MKKAIAIVMAVLIAQTSFLNARAEEVHIDDIPTEYIIYAWECENEFDVSASLLLSLCWQESRFKESVVGGNVTQITNLKWFKEAIEYCEADAPKDNPYQNIRICAYYLNKWAEEYPGETYLWLMMWNMGYENALRSYNSNKPSKYAKTIDDNAQKLQKEYEEWMNRIKP